MNAASVLWCWGSIHWGKRQLYLHMEINVYIPNRVCFIWSSPRARQKVWPFPSFTSLSAYRHDPVAGQISVPHQTDVATNNETLKYLPQYCWDVTAVSVLWKLMTGWLMTTHSILWARRGFKCREWSWLNEKSVQCSAAIPRSACGKLSKKRINTILTMSAILTTDLA